MALNIAKGKHLPIGVDLGSAVLKMAQMRQSDQGYHLVAAGSVQIPRDCRDDPARRMECIGRGIRSILKADIFKGRQCILSLPADATSIQHIKLPKLPAEQIPAAVRWELNGKLPYPVDDAIIRHVVAGDVFGDGEAKQELIVVAAANRTLNACLSMSRRAKLDVVGVNIEPCAIVECFARLFSQSADSGRTTLYLDMGERSTQVVLSHGSQIVFARNLPTGGKVFDQAVAAGLEVSVDKACQIRRDLAADSPCEVDHEQAYVLLDESINELTDELTQCLRYHESIFRNRGVERLVFLGGQAYDKRLCQAIAQRLNLAAQIGDPLVQVNKDQAATLATGLDQAGPQPDWAVAVGLSLGAASAA